MSSLKKNKEIINLYTSINEQQSVNKFFDEV